MKFFLDENFPKSAATWLAQFECEVFDLRGTEDEGMPDCDLFARAQELNAIILTTDRDFFHTVPHLFERHAGVLVVALRQPNRKNIMGKLEWALKHFSPSEFTNRVIQLRDKSWSAVPPIEHCKR